MTKNDQTITVAVLDGALENQTKRILTEVGGIINDFAFQVDQRFNKIEADIAELNRKYAI